MEMQLKTNEQLIKEMKTSYFYAASMFFIALFCMILYSVGVTRILGLTIFTSTWFIISYIAYISSGTRYERRISDDNNKAYFEAMDEQLQSIMSRLQAQSIRDRPTGKNIRRKYLEPSGDEQRQDATNSAGTLPGLSDSVNEN